MIEGKFQGEFIDFVASVILRSILNYENNKKDFYFWGNICVFKYFEVHDSCNFAELLASHTRPALLLFSGEQI